MDLMPHPGIKTREWELFDGILALPHTWTRPREWMGQVCGLIYLTWHPPICYHPLWEAEMRKSRNRLARLQQTGCALLQPERVRANLFLEHPEIFDARDAIQVKYEMLRLHLLEKRAISAVCRDFGFSRESFYAFAQRLREGGIAGLLPQKRGRKGPVKCTHAVLGFLHAERRRDPQASGAELQLRLREQMGVELHRRTVEKLALGGVGLKKKPEGKRGGKGHNRDT